MNSTILYITPPFTQLNTPYPATAYLKGYTDSLAISSYQIDLGLEVILKLFSKDGLSHLFSRFEKEDLNEENAQILFIRQDEYIQQINGVISFLQGRNNELAQKIVEGCLPEGPRFQQEEDLEWMFGSMGILDKAKYLSTLFLEDLGDFISTHVDPHFGFSRYAERISRSASSFDNIQNHLESEISYIENLLLVELEAYLLEKNPNLICITVPFPGNLIGALRIGQFVKKNYPQIKVAIGGGYPNTELRSLTDSRVFDYCDFISLDDGEKPIEQIIKFIQGDISSTDLKRTFMLNLKGEVEYTDSKEVKDLTFKEHATPTYNGLKLNKYISVLETGNLMHRLWSDGVWLKLTMAHGCYWGKCSFCDVSLDYIETYEPIKASQLVDRVEQLIKETGKSGFHFVDEAAPPSIMKEFALEVIKRKLNISWWTNIRFEKTFEKGLCQLLKLSGCIAVSGGLEVASNRLLTKMEKGVTVEQVAVVLKNFKESGILSHAYLMYGFPTQTEQETIDSLEVVRQMFATGILESGFWHQFAMTSHSPVGLNPSKYGVEAIGPEFKGFADNDKFHKDKFGADHANFSEGLRVSLHNFMTGAGLDMDVREWFETEFPETTLKEDYIESCLIKEEEDLKLRKWIYPRSIAIFGVVKARKTIQFLSEHEFELKTKEEILDWILKISNENYRKKINLTDLENSFTESTNLNWDRFKESYAFQQLIENTWINFN